MKDKPNRVRRNRNIPTKRTPPVAGPPDAHPEGNQQQALNHDDGHRHWPNSSTDGRRLASGLSSEAAAVIKKA